MEAYLAVALLVFEQAHLSMLDQWDTAINGEQYMSRRRPAPNATGPGTLPSPLWFLIEVDSTPIGTVWLEGSHTADEAILGIFLGDSLLFGGGIGRPAVEVAIKRLQHSTAVSRIPLNVRINNARAIAYYRHCGFMIIGHRESSWPTVAPFNTTPRFEN